MLDAAWIGPGQSSPLGTTHINVLGRYHFSLPETVARGEFRPLRDPTELDEENLLVTSPDANDF